MGLCSATLIIALTGSSASAALAPNYTKTAGKQNWSDGAIWSTLALPSQSNTVQIRKGALITVDTNAVAGEIRVFENSTLILNGSANVVVDDGAGGNNPVMIGYLTEGVLNVNGGSLKSSRLYLGYNATGSGIISGGIIECPFIYIGYTATGSANVTQTGGQVLTKSSLNINYTSGANGIYNLQGGTLTAGSLIFRTKNDATHSPFNWTGGTLKTADISYMDTWAEPNPVFNQTAGILDPTMINPDGSISEIAALRIRTTGTGDASYTLSGAGHLQMQLNGTSQGDYDQLWVEGTFTAGGTLDVALATGFKPKLGDRFTLIKAATINGIFSQVNLPALENGLDWNSDNLLTNGTLTVCAGRVVGCLLDDFRTGDFCEGSFYQMVRRRWNQPKTIAQILPL